MTQDQQNSPAYGSNRRDYFTGLLLALLLHGCLLIIIVGVWDGNTTQARPMFQSGESSLAVTFVMSPSSGTGTTPLQEAPPVVAPVDTEPEAEAEAPDSVAIPEAPVQPPEVQTVMEQPAEDVEAPSVLPPTEMADNGSTDIAPAQSGDGAAPPSDADESGEGLPLAGPAGSAVGPPSDADESSKGIQGLPRMSTAVRPFYPLGARRRGEQGNVIVRVQVGADGRVKGADISRSSNYPDLDQAALKAIRRTRFIPGQKNDVSVESESKITFRFQLEN